MTVLTFIIYIIGGVCTGLVLLSLLYFVIVRIRKTKGNILKNGIRTKRTGLKVFKCDKCGCVFETNEKYYKPGSYERQFWIRCIECNRYDISYEINGDKYRTKSVDKLLPSDFDGDCLERVDD